MDLTPKRARVLAVAIVVFGLLAAVVAARSGDPQDVLGDRAAPRLIPADQAPPASRLIGITDYGTGEPFTLEDYRGQVVLLDWWTYTCINCLRTFPELRALQQTYGDAGFQVIGVHSPEFDFEKDHDNVVDAIERLDVTWPVAEDPGLASFQTYGNRFWPTKHLIDRQGRIRYITIGEGGQETTEAAVRTLLAEDGGVVPEQGTGLPDADPSIARAITPETYFGGRDPQQFAGGAPVFSEDAVPVVRDDPEQARDVLRLTGEFLGDGESLEPLAGAVIEQKLRARNVFTTAGGTLGATLEVTLDGAPVPEGQRGADLTVDAEGRTVVEIDGSRLYDLVTGDRTRLATLRLTSLVPGAKLFTYTYGG